MWDCLHCLCQRIAAGVLFCPHCFKPREEDVPKVTSGGPSNAAAAPGEPGYISPDPEATATGPGTAQEPAAAPAAADDPPKAAKKAQRPSAAPEGT